MICNKLMSLNLKTMTFFIGAINHKGGDELLVNLVIEDSHSVKVKLDTGACDACSAIQSTWKRP